MTIFELAYVVLPLAVAILAAKFLGHIYGYPGYAIGFIVGAATGLAAYRIIITLLAWLLERYYKKHTSKD